MTQGSGDMPVSDREAVFDLLEKTARIPDAARIFDVPLSQARLRFRIPADVLEFLAGHGLPRTGSGESARYDDRDLTNVALHLGYSPVARAARRYWAAGLNGDPADGRMSYRIEYLPACPDPDHRGACNYRLALPGLGVVEREVDREARVLHRATVTPECDWPQFTEAERALLDEAASLDLMFVPRSLRYNLDFIRKARICDCIGATALLIEAAERYGVQARWAFGTIVVPPFASAHNWVEIFTGGRWVPADPVLIKAMVAWGALDPAEWPPYRSPGAIFVRLADQEVHIAEHDGVPVPVSMSLRPVRAPVASDNRL